MTDETMAPEASGGDNTPVTVITPAEDTGHDLSISQAAKALAAARHKPKEQAAESAEPQAIAEPELAVEADAEPVEEQPIGEPTEEVDPAATPPIDPPRSWTKEAKEQWQSLPRQTQEYLAQREQERDREVRRSQNETAEKLKGLTAKEQEVDQARQQYEAKLPALVQAIHENSPFSDIKTMADVEKLQAEDPWRFQQFQVYQWKMQGLQQEAQEVESKKAAQQQADRANFTREQNEKLFELLPEMKDPAKANEIRSRAVSMLVDDLGFTESELSSIMQSDAGFKLLNDARWQKLIANGLKYAEIQKAKTAAVSKPVPPVQRPGTSRPQGAAATEEIQALSRKLEQSGSLKDAQALRAAQARQASRAKH